MVGTRSSHVVDGDVMVSMLPSSVVDGGYKVQSCSTKSSHVVDGGVMVSMLPSSVVDGGYKVQSCSRW